MRIVRWMMVIAGIGLCLTASRSFAQGALTPPGVPTPTMKTLSQVEPRIAITTVPYTITQSGSYYLTTNLNSTGHGIVIQTNCVTLDLMGFSLTGDRVSVDHGIWVNGTTNTALGNIVVRGGIISGFWYGMRFDYVKNSRIDDLIISGNVDTGVHLNGDQGECLWNTVADCTISDNGSRGIYLSGVSGHCNGNTVRNCTISGNGNFGICLEGHSGGECAGNKLAHCVLRKNHTYGINCTQADLNRIENNHVSGTTGVPSYGIVITSSSGNVILQNSCMGQTANFTLSANDTYGPVVTNSGALATTNGAAALSPWANFSR